MIYYERAGLWTGSRVRLLSGLAAWLGLGTAYGVAMEVRAALRARACTRRCVSIFTPRVRFCMCEGVGLCGMWVGLGDCACACVCCGGDADRSASDCLRMMRGSGLKWRRNGEE